MTAQNPKKRGIAFSTDFITSLIIFLLVITSSIWIWDMVKYRVHTTPLHERQVQRLRAASDLLILTPGDPPTWHRPDNSQANVNWSAMKSFGLASEPYILDELKLKKFNESVQSDGSLDEVAYNYTQYLLGLAGEEYNLTIFTNCTSETPTILYDFRGNFSMENATQIHVHSRLALLNGEWVKVRLMIWRRRD